MEKTEQKVDKKTESKKAKVDEKNVAKPKEISVNLNELLNKVKNDAVAEMKKDFVNLAYRLMSVELCVYKLINKDVPKEFKNDILKQEDFLSANVETMLKRLKEIEQRVEEEKEKQRKAVPLDNKPEKEKEVKK